MMRGILVRNGSEMKGSRGGKEWCVGQDRGWGVPPRSDKKDTILERRQVSESGVMRTTGISN